MFNEKAVLAEIGKINEVTKNEVSWMRKGTTECEAEIATISPELGAIITTLRIRLRETSGKLLSLSFLHMVRDHALDTTSELYAAMNEVEEVVVSEAATRSEVDAAYEQLEMAQAAVREIELDAIEVAHAQYLRYVAEGFTGHEAAGMEQSARGRALDKRAEEYMMRMQESARWYTILCGLTHKPKTDIEDSLIELE